MSPPRVSALLAFGLFSLLTASSANAADKAPPAKPAAPSAAPTPPAKPAAPSPPAEIVALPPEAVQKARDGIVIIERGGRVVGTGSILQGDGRILTAFSAVSQGGEFELRYVDGSTTKAHITQSDRTSDLALLTVNAEARKQGLRASRRIEDVKDAHTFSVAPAKKLVANRLNIKGNANFVATSGKPVGEGLELASPVKPGDIGAPLLNDVGEVIAIIARACAANAKANCAPAPFGAPVSLVRSFLRGAVPKSEAAAAPPPPAVPWLGIEVVPGTAGPARGARLTQIHPDSPAAAAGLKAGHTSEADMLVAVDGIPVASANGLDAALRERKIGDSVELLLFGAGRFRQVSLIMKAAPGTGAPPKAALPPPLRSPATGPKPVPSKPAAPPASPRNH